MQIKPSAAIRNNYNETALLRSRFERLDGAKTYTIAETLAMMDKVIENARNINA